MPLGTSPCRKSFRANSVKASRKSLNFATTAEQPQQAIKDCIDSNLNIEDLPIDGTLQVKVVIVDSTSKLTTRIPHEEESKQIVRQLCNKNWQATASIISRHKDPKAEVVKSPEKKMCQKKWLATRNPKVFCS